MAVHTMPDRDTALTWIGQRVDDVYGGRLGKAEEVYVDERTGAPVWLSVRLGRFGDEHALVPVLDAVDVDGGVWTPHERQAVKSAVPLAPGGAITREHDLALAAHYGMREARERELADLPAGARSATPASGSARPA